MKSVLFAACLACLASHALADPCRATPDKGPAPAWLHRGVTFSGPVTYIADGDGLCVVVVPGRERDSATWVEVRIADFYAPELSTPEGARAKEALERVALGKSATCVFEKQSYDRAVAVCRIGGRSVGDALRDAGIAEGGRAYPPARSRR